MGEKWKQGEILFSWAPKSLQMVTAAMKLKDVCSLEEKLWQPRQHIKKQRHYIADKSPHSQSYAFSSSHVWMWELDHKEGWVLKNWCFQTVMLEKTLEESLGQQGTQTSQSLRKSALNIHWKDWCWSWSSNTLAIWCKAQTHWKRPWCWKRLRTGERGNRRWDGGWYHQLKLRHEFEKTQRDEEGQESLACCSTWGSKELDLTEWLNNNNPLHQNLLFWLSPTASFGAISQSYLRFFLLGCIPHFVPNKTYLATFKLCIFLGKKIRKIFYNANEICYFFKIALMKEKSQYQNLLSIIKTLHKV